MRKVLAVAMAAVCAVMVAGCSSVSQEEYDALYKKHLDLAEQYSALKEKKDELAEQVPKLQKENEKLQAEISENAATGEYPDSLLDLVGAEGDDVTYSIMNDTDVMFFLPIKGEVTVTSIRAAHEAAMNCVSTIASITAIDTLIDQNIFCIRCIDSKKDVVFEYKLDSYTSNVSMAVGTAYLDLMKEAIG